MKAKTKPFSRMSAAAKRIAICQDILKQIKADRYNIKTGTWLTIDPVETQGNENRYPSQAELLQNALLGGNYTVTINSPPASCTCCAVGAACASAIRLFNQDTLPGSPGEGYDLGDYADGMEILQKYFPKAQVDLMEAAFEMRTDGHHVDASESSLERAEVFGSHFDQDERRLEEICKNIINNNGTFKP